MPEEFPETARGRTRSLTFFRIQELLVQLLKGLRVETQQTFVSVEPGRGVKLAELLPLIAKNGL